jgi:multidrug efflux pump subunit AcrB
LQLGETAWEASLNAALEVATPVLASTLVIIVVFFPVLFLTGIAKFLFSPLAITVAAAMVGSYIFSLTLVPLFAAYLFRNKLPKTADNKSGNSSKTFFQRIIERLRIRYEASLKGALKYRWAVLTFTAVLFVSSLFILKNRLGIELFPASDVGQMEIQVRLESGTPLTKTAELIEEMEQTIKTEVGSELKQMISNLGIFYDLPAAYTPNSGTMDAFIGLQLTEKHQTSTFEYAKRLRKILRHKFPGVELSFNTGGLITAALNEGKPSPIDIQVKGNNLDVMREITERIKDTVAAIQATRDVRILQRIDQPTKNIDIDRIKAAELGVEPVDAIKNIVSALNSSATFDKSFWIDERNGNHYYVGVTYPEYLINDENVLSNVTVASQTSDNAVPFRNFSSISESTNPVEINHHNLTREMNVYANTEGTDIGSVSEEIQRRLNQMEFPKGYAVKFQGEVATMKSSFGDLGLGLGLAIILVFLILIPLFRSFRQPLIIIIAFPLGLIGVAYLMWATNTNLNIQSIMGIIMMVGIAVAYGNILIDRINVLVKDGKEKREAIVRGASDRFRPVLMTSATTIFGLLPTALAGKAGAEANVPLAIAVIGGTFMATLLTLYIIPIMYLLIAKTNN